MSQSKCKPCPFCGSDDLIPSFYDVTSDDPSLCIACEKCDAEGPPVTFRRGIGQTQAGAEAMDEAYKLWNARWEIGKEGGP